MKVITPLVHVINLGRATERWTTISERCRRIGQPISRFKAVDGNDIKFVRRSGFDIRNRYHEACYQSHCILWHKFMLDMCSQYACILEDDAIVLAPIRDVAVPDNFDIVYINDRMLKGDGGKAINGCGTDGYILSREGCRKLITICEDIDKPLDLRIQAHVRGFIETGHGICGKNGKEVFVSRLHPDIVIEGYKSRINYIEHNDSCKSYIR
ncbi:MAG: glycosyltransferase family 25 protein [Nitrospirae bacterium]|nr:glycosyltransferase family 25 protein [Nitrospirota bacterium]